MWPMFPPKPFDYLEGLDAFRFFFNNTAVNVLSVCASVEYSAKPEIGSYRIELFLAFIVVGLSNFSTSNPTSSARFRSSSLRF